MTRRRARTVRVAIALALVTAAGAVAPAALATGTPSGSYRKSGRALNAAAAQAGLANINVEYHGGPVISNVSVHSVYWGNGSYEQGAGPNDSDITSFLSGVTASSYMDWM